MKAKIVRTAAGLIAAAVLFSVAAYAAEPLTSAKSAMLMDGSTGRVLWEKNASKRQLIASTTKIMTGLIIIEDCDLSAEVAIPEQAVSVEGSSMGLQKGEILTVEQLLYGLMLESGNDAAVALAMYHAGSLEAFSEKMNEKAEKLGLSNTHFDNPHGLDSAEHYSSALDLATLTAAAMENPEFHRIVSTKSVSFGRWSLSNHNKLLWSYDGAVGVKTGYTKAAGRILVSAAERDGRRLIAVTICDPNDWEDHKRLLDYGFSAYQNHELAVPGQVVSMIPVLCGADDYVPVVIRNGITIPLANGERAELELELPPVVFAPVLAGDEAGVVSVIINGTLFGKYPLYWRDSVLEEA